MAVEGVPEEGVAAEGVAAGGGVAVLGGSSISLPCS